MHDIERLLLHARSPPIFQHLLAYIRAWAQHTGIYGQVCGYLCGYAWAILCSHTCHRYLSPIKSVKSIENFSIDDFFSLVKLFFSTFEQFNWSTETFTLHSQSSEPIVDGERSAVCNRGAMRILSPSPPFTNAARATKKSTRKIIVDRFRHVSRLLDSQKSVALEEILEQNHQFPNENMKSIIQFTIASKTLEELDSWIGWIKSRLSFFFSDCEETCHYVFQPQSNIEYQSNRMQALYAIAFPVEQNVLEQSQKFTTCLQRFISQTNGFSNRTQSMTFSHRIMSIEKS